MSKSSALLSRSNTIRRSEVVAPTHPFDGEVVIVSLCGNDLFSTPSARMSQEIYNFLQARDTNSTQTFVFVNDIDALEGVYRFYEKLDLLGYGEDDELAALSNSIQQNSIVSKTIALGDRTAKVLFVASMERIAFDSIPHDSHVYIADAARVDVDLARYLCDNMASVFAVVGTFMPRRLFPDLDTEPLLPITIEWHEYFERTERRFRSHAPVLPDAAIGLVALDLPVLLTLEIAEWLRAANCVFGRYRPETKRWRAAQLVKRRAHAIGTFVYED